MPIPSCAQDRVRVLVPHGPSLFGQGPHPQSPDHGSLQPRQHLEGSPGALVSQIVVPRVVTAVVHCIQDQIDNYAGGAFVMQY